VLQTEASHTQADIYMFNISLCLQVFETMTLHIFPLSLY